MSEPELDAHLTENLTVLENERAPSTARDASLAAVLARFADFADPARLADLSGVVRFEVTFGKRGRGRHHVLFVAGTATLANDSAPEVTIALSAADFVAMVTGRANAALLYLGGRMQVEGRELLALDVGSAFRVAGSGRAAVDPTALDPVDVATAVATSSAAHMKAVMAGGFRPIVLSEVFRRFPEFLDEDKARRMRCSVGFRVGGRADGEVDRYVVHVADGACTVETDPPEGQRRDATIILGGADFLRLATGQLNPVKGVLTGHLKVRGDRAKALAFNAAMNPPQPRSLDRG